MPRTRDGGAVPSPFATLPAGSPQRRLHVLHVTATSAGPLAAQVLEYVRDQLDRGWTVTVACPSRGELGFAARDLGARVRWWNPADASRALGPHVWAPIRSLRLALGDPGELGADVAHLHGRRAGMLGRLVLRHRVVTVYQPYGSSTAGREPGEAPRGDRRRRDALGERLVRRWTSQVVCGSRAEADRVRASDARAARRAAAAEDAGDGDRVALVGLGVDVTRWLPPGPGDRSAARARLGLGSAVVVCIGPLSSPLARAEIVAAWPDVRRGLPGARLVLVGDGSERDGVEAGATSSAGVTVAAGRSDLPTWIAAADVVLAVGPQAPLTALRAMASARSVVVVADRLSGAGEVVVAGTGAVVAAGDRAALASALLERLVAPELAEDEGWCGRRHVERHHDSADTARDLARIYPRLVAARRT